MLAAFEHYDLMYEAWSTQIEPALRLIESPLAGRLHDRFAESNAFLTQINNSLQAKLKDGQTPRIR